MIAALANRQNGPADQAAAPRHATSPRSGECKCLLKTLGLLLLLLSASSL